MDVAGFVIVGVRVIAVVMAAVGGLAGGEKVEEAEHRKPETADEGDRPEIRSEVFVDAAGGVEIQQHRAPDEHGQGKQDAPELGIHFAWNMRCCQKMVMPPMARNNPSASAMMKFLRITV